MCGDIMVKKDSPLRGTLRNDARDECSGIVQVNGGNFDVRVKGVLVERYSTSSKMSHFKMTRPVIVLEVLDCFLQGDDMPFSRNVFLNDLLSLVVVPDSSSKC